MFECPECKESMKWEADHQEEEEVFYSHWSCGECNIDLTKAYFVMVGHEE